ncbi:MAG: hypothetical protein QM611_00395 [Microbacterium sp.]|uniref:aggregation-promoting factor C-terminal-like domain-containing protein n=1 Tax=Microbacterium sp. TaxID=51671 RepID=UPI0039E71416
MKMKKRALTLTLALALTLGAAPAVASASATTAQATAVAQAGAAAAAASGQLIAPMAKSTKILSPKKAKKLAKRMLVNRGFRTKRQFKCLVKLWNHESGWRVTAGTPSGAYGIPQAYPGSKMKSKGSDWRTSAHTQIRWGIGYIKNRYKTPCRAWHAFQRKGWY